MVHRLTNTGKVRRLESVQKIGKRFDAAVVIFFPTLIMFFPLITFFNFYAIYCAYVEDCCSNIVHSDRKELSVTIFFIKQETIFFPYA